MNERVERGRRGEGQVSGVEGETERGEQSVKMDKGKEIEWEYKQKKKRMKKIIK